MRDLRSISSRLSKLDDQLEGEGQEDCVVIGDMVYDTTRGLLTKDNRTKKLGKNLAKFLRLFGEKPGSVLSKEEILRQIYGDHVRSEDIIRTQISLCRRVMAAVGSDCRIVNHHSFGWEFVCK